MSTTGAPTSGHALPRGDVSLPRELDRHRLRRGAITLAAVVVGVVLVVVLAPGLASLRHRFAGAQGGWLAVGVVFKVASGLSYVAIFRAVFCARMRWRTSAQIGLSELGANAVIPTGGAGGLALGAWALRRRGMPGERIARRTVAFFLLTSLANVTALILVGLLLAVHAVPGRANLALTLIPAGVAVLGVALVLGAGRLVHAARRSSEARGQGDTKRAKVLGALGDGVHESVELLRAHDPWLVFGAIGYLAFDIMVLWATFHAFGHPPAVAIIWIAYLIGELGGLVPLPGGIGGVDLGLVGTFVLYHVQLATATAAVLAYRAIAIWVPVVVGSVAFMFLRRTLRTDSEPALADQSC